MASFLWAVLFLTGPRFLAQARLLPHDPLIPTDAELARLKHVRALLASSTREHPNTARIVFYGQSITTYSWWLEVGPLLKAAYPTVDFQISNLAIPGFQDAYLERTAPSDLIPVVPDLLIIHAFGPGTAMLRLLKDYRAATGSDAILQQDFPLTIADLTEDTNPATIRPDDQWPQRNYISLPAAADGSGSCLARFREPWKDYCRTNGIDPASILSEADHFHPGVDSGHLLAEYISAYLLPYGKPAELDPWNCSTVRTLDFDPRGVWTGGRLECEVTGRIVQLGFDQTTLDPVDVLIDGVKPSAHQELYANTRVSVTQNHAWPTLSRVSWQAPVVAEDWTFIPFDFTPNQQWFRFRVVGSVTGDDGVGTNTVRFVSKSGRVVIEDYDHWLARTVYFDYGRVPDGFTATWSTYCRGMDRVNAGLEPAKSGVAEIFNLANGLSDKTHRLVLTTKPGSEAPFRFLRVRSPAGQAAINVTFPLSPGRLVSRNSEGRQLLNWALDSGWILKSATTLGPSTVWTEVPLSRIQREADRFTFLLPESDTLAFYRLEAADSSH